MFDVTSNLIGLALCLIGAAVILWAVVRGAARMFSEVGETIVGRTPQTVSGESYGVSSARLFFRFLAGGVLCMTGVLLINFF